MPWNLTVTDLGNGNGAALAITAPAGNATTYRVQRATVTASAIGAYADLAFTETVSTTPTFTGTGSFAWQIVDESNHSTVLAGPVIQAATAEGDSVHERCLIMLQDRFTNLNLTGLLGGVEIRQASEPSNLSYPCVVLSIADLSEDSFGSNTGSEDYGYRILVQIAERTQYHSDANRARHLAWRKTLRDSIHHRQRFDLRVPEVWIIEVEMNQVIAIPQSSEKTDYRVGMFTAVCKSREMRLVA